MASRDASPDDSGREPVENLGGPIEGGPAGPTLTAYVIMRAADGSSSLSRQITSDNIAELQPTAEAVGRVGAACSDRGFEVGPFVGVSFAITGPPELFSRSFDLQADGSLRFDSGEDQAVTELVETVIMDEPAELFGSPTGSDQ